MPKPPPRPIIATQPKAPGWRPTRAVVVRAWKGQEDDTAAVEGFLLGNVFVWLDHATKKWTVGAMGCGLALTRVSSEALAQRVGQYLYENINTLLGIEDPDQLLEHIGDEGSWVRPWCLALKKADTWIEPDNQ